MKKMAKALVPVAGAAVALMLLPTASANANTVGTGSAKSGGHAGHAANVAKRPGCKPGELLQNGSFEQPKLARGTDYMQYSQGQVPGWRTTDPAGKIEIWGKGMNVPATDGKQIAELNATGNADTVYQDVRTVPGTKLNWSLSIRARNSTDAKDVDATSIHFAASPPQGAGGAQGTSGAFGYTNSSDDTHWKTLYGWYQVPQGQNWTRVAVTSVSHAGDTGYGNLVDDISVNGNKC